MSKMTDGEVAITLAGERRVLKPSLRAISSLSSQFGGLAKLRESLVSQDLQAVTAVIQAGLNVQPREAKELPERVYETGLSAELIIPLIMYVGILANGGKPLPEDPDDAPEPESAEGNG